jgi:hypothetical protein
MMAWLKGGQGWIRTVLTAWVIVLLLLWVSGVVLRQWPAQALLEMSEWEQTLRRTAQVLHGVCTWVICLLSGRGLWPHLSLMWKGRARQQPWWWGCASLLLLLVLSVSGLMLLYGAEPLLALMSDLHFWIGLLLPLVLTLHVGLMKRRAVKA